MSVFVVYGNDYLSYKEAVDIMVSEKCFKYKNILFSSEIKEDLSKDSAIIYVKGSLEDENFYLLIEKIKIMVMNKNNTYVIICNEKEDLARNINNLFGSEVLTINRTLDINSGVSKERSLENWLDIFSEDKGTSLSSDVIDYLIQIFDTDRGLFFLTLASIDRVKPELSINFQKHNYVFHPVSLKTWKLLYGQKSFLRLKSFFDILEGVRGGFNQIRIKSFLRKYLEDKITLENEEEQNILPVDKIDLLYRLFEEGIGDNLFYMMVYYYLVTLEVINVQEAI